MNGLDRIIDGILEDAKKESKKTIAEAKAKSDEIMQRAKERFTAVIDDAKLQAENEYNRMMKSAKSAADATENRLLLTEKQKIIENVVTAAKEKILKLDDDSYFEFMERLLNKCAANTVGELVLSEHDKVRVNKSFIKAIKEKELTISDEIRSIDGGFVLIYGNIEENCSITAVMDSEREKLYDTVNSFLF